jgi:hypothetical protein
MTDAIAGTRKRGRPATGAVSIHLRIEPAMLARVDAWINAQPDRPSRPEAIRQLIGRSLADALPDGWMASFDRADGETTD